MADRGFLKELGVPDLITASHALQFDPGSQPNQGTFGQFFNIGRQLGRGIAPGVGALAGMIPGQGGFKQGAQDVRNTAIAQAMGTTPQKVQKLKQFESQVSSLKQPQTDDPIEDQIATYRKIAQEANSAGLSDVAVKATAKVAQLRRDQLTRRQLENTIEGQEVTTKSAKLDYQYEAGTPREMWRATDTGPAAPHTVRAITTGPDAGKFMVVGPDGTQEVQDSLDGFTSLDPIERQRKADALGDTRNLINLKRSLDLNGYSTAGVNKAKESFSGVVQQVDAVADIADMFNSLHDPSQAMSFSGKAQVAAEKGVTLIDNFLDMLAPETSGTNTWTKTLPNGRQVTRNVSSKQQFQNAQSKMNDLKDELLPQILPEGIKRNSKAAELYWANMMYMAYLDARSLEPANRGLSDTDVENSLRRLAGESSNPATFALRQLQVVDRLHSEYMLRRGNISAEQSPYTADELRRQIWAPEVASQFDESMARAKLALEEVIGRHGSPGDYDLIGGDYQPISGIQPGALGAGGAGATIPAPGQQGGIQTLEDVGNWLRTEEE